MRITSRLSTDMTQKAGGLVALALLLAACSHQQTSTDLHKPASDAAVPATTSTTASAALPLTTDEEAVASLPANDASTTTAPAPTDTHPVKSKVAAPQSSAPTATALPADSASISTDDAQAKPEVASAVPPIEDNAENEAEQDNIQLTQQHTLNRFSAHYRIYVSKIPTTIKADLTLSPTKQADTWNMQFKIDSLLMDNLEDSTFVWNNCNPRSLHYHHEFKGFGKRHFNDTHFSWDQPPTVTNRSADGKTTFEIPPEAVDDLTVLLRAACVFNEGIHDFKATSVYGDEIRTNHFRLVREETLKTAIGNLHTLVIEKVRKKKSSRQTLFWVAPELNYMLVKARHTENAALFGEVILKKYDGPTVKK